MESTHNELVVAECEDSDFKLTDLQEKETTEIAVVQEAFDACVEDDFDKARATIKSLLENGDDVMTTMIALAKASDHPRAYEVVATLMKTMADINMDLIGLHEKKKKLRDNTPDVPSSQTNVQNNSVFVGTAAEAQKILSGQN